MDWLWYYLHVINYFLCERSHEYNQLYVFLPAPRSFVALRIGAIEYEFVMYIVIKYNPLLRWNNLYFVIAAVSQGQNLRPKVAKIPHDNCNFFMFLFASGLSMSSMTPPSIVHGHWYHAKEPILCSMCGYNLLSRATLKHQKVYLINGFSANMGQLIIFSTRLA